MKFTFKSQPKPTGLSRVGSPYANIDIKLAKKDIGTIHAPTWQSAERSWSITIRTKRTPDAADPCPWKNTKIKANFPDANSAKDWIRENLERLLVMNNLELVSRED